MTMSDDMKQLIVTAIIVPALGAVWWMIKHQIEKYDKQRQKERDEAEEKRNAEIAERNAQRDEMKGDIKDLKTDLLNLQSIVVGCENPDCQAKKVLAEYLRNKTNRK